MSWQRRPPVVASVFCILALTGLVVGRASVAGEEADVWEDLRPLVGTWKGEGSGFGVVSEVTHEWQFVLGANFLRLRTQSVPQRDAPSAEIHEDIGFMSRDTDGKTFVFRQFLSEGFVNTFDVTMETGDKWSILFEHRSTESGGGMRARMRMVFVESDEYEMTLDLAGPNGDFAPCQTMHMKKAD